MASLLLIDDDQAALSWMSAALEARGHDVKRCARARDALAALESASPDLIVADILMPEMDGLAFARLVRKHRGVPLMFVSIATKQAEAVLAGAVGYLERDVDAARLPQILHAVLAGEVALPRRHSQHVLEALRRRDAQRARLAALTDARLTEREWEVLEMLADGRSTAEIGLRLGISTVTARRHISSLVTKLGVADRAAAAELVRRSDV